MSTVTVLSKEESENIVLVPIKVGVAEITATKFEKFHLLNLLNDKYKVESLYLKTDSDIYQISKRNDKWSLRSKRLLNLLFQLEKKDLKGCIVEIGGQFFFGKNKTGILKEIVTVSNNVSRLPISSLKELEFVCDFHKVHK
ncbi:MAG: hypothetical protein WCO35_02845 [Candidatus Nomurabacteria bacterium]